MGCVEKLVEVEGRVLGMGLRRRWKPVNSERGPWERV